MITEPTVGSAVLGVSPERGYEFHSAIYTRERESTAKSDVRQISRAHGHGG